MRQLVCLSPGADAFCLVQADREGLHGERGGEYVFVRRLTVHEARAGECCRDFGNLGAEKALWAINEIDHVLQADEMKCRKDLPNYPDLRTFRQTLQWEK